MQKHLDKLVQEGLESPVKQMGGDIAGVDFVNTGSKVNTIKDLAAKGKGVASDALGTYGAVKTLTDKKTDISDVGAAAKLTEVGAKAVAKTAAKEGVKQGQEQWHQQQVRWLL